MADEIDLVSDINSGDLDAGQQGTVQAPAGTQPAQGADAVQANQAPAKVETQETSLRDQLSAAFKDKSGEPTDQGTAANAGERARDPATGQFIPTAAEQAAAAAQAGQPGAAQPVQAPAWFAPADAQQFASLPPEQQSLIARTVASVEQVAARYHGYDAIEQVIGPRREAWAMNGTSEAQAIQQLFAISDFATRSPQDFVLWYSQQHGIDLEALSDQSGEEIDPVVAGLRSEVQRLSGQLTQFTQGAAVSQHNAVVDEVGKFASEAGTDGQPLRPYLPELGAGFTPYVQQVKAENPAWSHSQVLQEAYERACWGTPAVRTKLLAAQEALRLTELRTKTATAKAAGSSVNGDAPTAGSQVPNDAGDGSVRDTLKRQFAAAKV